jgi:indole-3-glycerol phosphate synthase
MNILQKIVAEKRADLSLLKKDEPLEILMRKEPIRSAVPRFIDNLSKYGPSIIAEFKRRSPSKGDINLNASVEETILAYSIAGASAISVLTDKHFGGSTLDFRKAAAISPLPLLRKDFIVDVYQIYESKMIGASAILLIASVLEKEQLKDFYQLATEQNLDVLFEIHNSQELDKLPEDARLIGINNRNLETFKVDIQNSITLFEKLPKNCVKISESGISEPETIKTLFDCGFDAFLMGEQFMKSEQPAHTVEEFFSNLKKLFSDDH